MPTIPQLPRSASVTAADTIPISQNGEARSTTLGTLLGNVQPTILIPSKNLLGRSSIGVGGPEPVALGNGLALENNTLTVTPFDPMQLPSLSQLSSSDSLVGIGASGMAQVSLNAIRSLFQPGAHIAIDASGTISAEWPGPNSGQADTLSSIAQLPTIASGTAQAILPINQQGTTYGITVEHLLNGLTIDQASAAAAASDADTLWVAQSGNTMVRQNFSALWQWVINKMPAYKPPVIEVSQDLTLDVTNHNGRVLLCKAPIRLTAIPANMGSGFHCEVINLSTGMVLLEGAFIASLDFPALAPRQTAQIRCLSSEGTPLLYAQQSAMAPGSARLNIVADITYIPGASAISFDWNAPVGGGNALGYTINHRALGATTWLAAGIITSGTTFTITGLLPSTVYEVRITAFNEAGGGEPSTISVSTTALQDSVPGQATNLTAADIGPTYVTINWQSPSSGGVVSSYSLLYRPSGSLTWSGQINSIVTTSQTVSGLTASTLYEFKVTAFNAGGGGPPSEPIAASTTSTPGAVSNIVWNVAPYGQYSSGGAIGVNAHVTPASAPIRFGFSTELSSPPSAWTDAVPVNTDLWGAYVATPGTPGTWYAWAQGTDGSCSTIYASPFTVA